MSCVVARKPAGIDLGARPEQNAVGVDQEDAPVRPQRAEDLRGAEPAGHPVKLDRTCARHGDLGFLAGADIERVPVDDGAVGLLRDGDGRGALALDGGAAADHLRPERIGRGRREPERHQGRGREQKRCGRACIALPLILRRDG